MSEKKEFDNEVKIKNIAMICHEANRALCETLGDYSQASWKDAPQWQKDSAIDGVNFNLDNPHLSASASHDNWLKEKEAAGWKYGEVKNPELKEHPCFVPYEQLPIEQQVKDHLFKATVDALRSLVGPPERYVKISMIDKEEGAAIYIKRSKVGYTEEIGLYQHALAITMQSAIAPQSIKHKENCPHSNDK